MMIEADYSTSNYNQKTLTFTKMLQVEKIETNEVQHISGRHHNSHEEYSI
jgi:hypothetical protein